MQPAPETLAMLRHVTSDYRADLTLEERLDRVLAEHLMLSSILQAVWRQRDFGILISTCRNVADAIATLRREGHREA